MAKLKVGILMGSDSDLPIIRKAVDTLVALDIPYEVHVYSAHRTPAEAADFASNARARGFGAIIAAAGMAAHLAGAVAAQTTLPVIGVRGHGCYRRRCQCRFALCPDVCTVRRGAGTEADRQTCR